MNFRLKTSKYAENNLKQLESVLKFTPNIIARIAVAMSLRIPDPLGDLKLDHSGQEFNRNTLTGEYDYVFKALIAQHTGREITDDEYFPSLFNAHLERGLRLLVSEYKLAGNSEKLFRSLIMSSEV